MLPRWRDAMDRALYGDAGFFVSPSGAPSAHFRTSAHASPLFVAALLRLLELVDSALGEPRELDVVDIGAGRGELLRGLHTTAPEPLRSRLRLVGVELAPRPADLPPAVAWQPAAPPSVAGLLLATEWLDNVPVDVAWLDDSGTVRYLHVDPSTGTEVPGAPVAGADARWLDRWWPLSAGPPGARAEIGLPRDAAWAAALSTVQRGLAVCVDYGHLRSGRPPFGTLTGFRAGRQVPPIPDGSCDLTAHVAVDALPGTLLSQREALRALGVSGARPPLALAATDPAGYVRALATASSAAELTDPGGLGGHYWLIRPVGIALPLPGTP